MNAVTLAIPLFLYGRPVYFRESRIEVVMWPFLSLWVPVKVVSNISLEEFLAKIVVNLKYSDSFEGPEKAKYLL